MAKKMEVGNYYLVILESDYSDYRRLEICRIDEIVMEKDGKKNIPNAKGRFYVSQTEHQLGLYIDENDNSFNCYFTQLHSNDIVKKIQLKDVFREMIKILFEHKYQYIEIR